MKRWVMFFCAGLLLSVQPLTLQTAWGDAPKEIRIGATIALSGRFQGMVGEFEKLGKAWTDIINEQGGIYVKEYGKKIPIHFEVYDDGSKPENARKFYEKMATDENIHFFMGPFSSFISNAAITVAGKHKIPMVLVEANDQVLFETPNYWRVSQLAPAEMELQRLVQIYKAKGGLKTFAILSMDTLHNKGSANGLANALTQAGFEVVYHHTAPADTKDFASIITRMKQAAPDAVVVESISPPFNIGFLKQMRETGMKPKELVVGHVVKNVMEPLGSFAENITGVAYYFDGDTEDHKEFAEMTRRVGFTWADYMESGIRFWAYKTIQRAIEQAGTLDREQLMKTLWSMKINITGLEMAHDEKGFGTLYGYPCQVQNGEFVSIWPLEKALKLHKFRN